MREARKAGKVKIVSMDRGNEILDAIKEGVISASVAQQTALMPYYATSILYNLYNSKVAITSNNKAANVLGHPRHHRHRRHRHRFQQLHVLQALS